MLNNEQAGGSGLMRSCNYNFRSALTEIFPGFSMHFLSSSFVVFSPIFVFNLLCFSIWQAKGPNATKQNYMTWHYDEIWKSSQFGEFHVNTVLFSEGRNSNWLGTRSLVEVMRWPHIGVAHCNVKLINKERDLLLEKGLSQTSQKRIAK